MIDPNNSPDFFQIFEQLVFPVLVLSSDQTILFANQAFYNLTKYSNDKIQLNKIIDENVRFWDFLVTNNIPQKPMLFELKIILRGDFKR